MIIDKIILAAYVPWWPNIIMGCLCCAIFCFFIWCLCGGLNIDGIIYPKPKATSEKNTTIRIIIKTIREGEDENTADDNENKAKFVESKPES